MSGKITYVLDYFKAVREIYGYSLALLEIRTKQGNFPCFGARFDYIQVIDCTSLKLYLK